MRDLTKISADEYNAAIVRNAVEFTATRKAGVGRYETHRVKDRAEAIAIGESMGRGTIIYAIDANGRQGIIGTIR